jgi:pleiotropic regulator 1
LAAGKTMVTLTHHKKSVRALTIHPTEFSFATGSAGGNNIKKWKCPEGIFVHNFSGHDAIINTLSVNDDGVLFSGGKLKDHAHHAAYFITDFILQLITEH